MKILNHLLTIAAVAAAMSFIGCSHDIEMSNPGQGGAEGIPFTFTVESPSSSSAVQAITRSIKSDDVDGTSYDRLRAVWAAGDELSVMLDHDGTYTFSKATITKINSDSTHAAFTTTLDASAAVGDKVTVFYPTLTDKDSLVINYCGNWYNTPQDGTVASLAKLDPIMGSSTLATVSTAGATVAQNIKMDIPETDASNNNSFGSAYYGIKVQKIDTIKQRNFDSNGVLVSTDIKSIETVPLKVLKLTLSIQNKDTAKQDNNWYTKATFDPNTGNCKWTRDYFDDSITVVPKDGKATSDRLYMAVPKVNDGLTATFCVQDSDGYVYTCDKKIPAKAGNYYPVTLTMHHARYVNLGDKVDWANHNVGGDSPEDYGDYFAWGEIKPKPYYYWLPESYRQYFGDDYMYKWGSAGEGFTKYSSTDKKSRLDPEDDAATANWGEPWRMPTTEEIYRMCWNVWSTWETDTVNGVDGIKVTSKANGNSIFLPAGGFMFTQYNYPISGRWQSEVGYGAYYWSSDLYENGGVHYSDGTIVVVGPIIYQSGQEVGRMLGKISDNTYGFGSTNQFGIGGGHDRCYGLLVRPVRANKNVTHIKK